jgi:transcription termination/antitermination protein NusG
MNDDTDKLNQDQAVMDTGNTPVDQPVDQPTPVEEEAQVPEDTQPAEETPVQEPQAPESGEEPAVTEVAEAEETQPAGEDAAPEEEASDNTPEETASSEAKEAVEESQPSEETSPEEPAEPATSAQPASEPTPGKWYVVHTYSGHENKVLENLRQKIASEHLENKIFDMLVPTQDKIEIRGGKKEQVKEKIFPGYILVKMDLDDSSWLAIRTTPGVTSFVGMGNKPTPISEAEVKSIVQFMNQGAAPTFKEVFLENDTVKIIDGPFAEFIGKVDSVDKEHGKVRVLVSIFGRETPVELDFLQVQKL